MLHVASLVASPGIDGLVLVLLVNDARLAFSFINGLLLALGAVLINGASLALPGIDGLVLALVAPLVNDARLAFSFIA